MPDCGMLVVSINYKPFMWCRSDARLWPAWYFQSLISPLCGVAQAPDCGMLVIPFIYKPFMWCRLDARLRYALYYYPFEASLQTPDRCILFLPSGCLLMSYMINLLVCIIY